MMNYKGFLLIPFLAFTFISCNQEKAKTAVLVKEKPQIVEASCGQCQFGLKSQKGCDLAVRIEGQAYFVDGTDIDEHGDAHANEGFCNAIRKAEVVGHVEKGRFVAKEFKLIKE